MLWEDVIHISGIANPHTQHQRIANSLGLGRLKKRGSRMIDGNFFFLQNPLFFRKNAYFCGDKLKYHYMRAYKSHFNFQGHHPKVRPWNRHADYDVSIKVARLLSPKVMLLCASEEKLLEMMVVEMGCPDSGMWYVDTAGCAMLQANDAEPPPQRGWLRKAMQCAAVFLLGLMLLAGPTSCKKDPQPSPTPTPNTPTDTLTPVNPNDTITPVNPGDTITPTPGTDTIIPGPGGDTLQPVPGRTKEYLIDFYPSAGGAVFPSLDSMREWVSVYDTVRLFVCAPSHYWTPGSFHVARDSLSPRFDVSPKVRGGWWWCTYQILDDELVNSIGVMGMIRSDSTQFADWGYGIYPQITGKKVKSAQPPHYNGNRVLRAGRSH